MNDNETAQGVATGGCLCGGVRYELRTPLRDVWACHCGQCRRTHGHYAAYTNVPRDHFRLAEDRSLRWYASSTEARRGFCNECGASLFWERTNGDTISVSAGTLDPPTGLQITGHIFVADAGDYYHIDHPVQRPGSMRD